jgi:nicotinate-nucleotide pyrophosphorylase (carboxylating)
MADYDKIPSYLSTGVFDAILERALDEDIGSGDVTTLWTIPENSPASGFFLAREAGTVAGLIPATRVFTLLDDETGIEWSVGDGDTVAAGDRLGTISGRAKTLLQGERVALNLIQRMSGIATMTASFVAEALPHRARILDTRKTAPGLRLLDKWAVLLGGGMNHRVGLFDMVLIKENHIVAAGGLEAAITSVRVRNATGLSICVEAQTLDEVQQILDTGGVNRILLDNMVTATSDSIDTSRLEAAVKLIAGQCETEASGNVRLNTVQAIAGTGVDYISSGALTHSVRALDISLLFTLQDRG